MDIKRDAIGVVDAINAEDMGKFPDTNLAESMQRITGVSIDRANGEGSRITVRGFGGDNGPAMMAAFNWQGGENPEPEGGIAVQGAAMAAALLGALLLTWTERKAPRQQEALIGVMFILAACAGILLLAGNPHGGEHLKDLLVGQILWVSTQQLIGMAALTVLVLALWFGLRERLARHSAADLAALFERVGLPFAPIRTPEELFDDEHLNATGGLADITLPDGKRAGDTARTTLLPFTMNGERLGVRLQPPRQGAHTRELLAQLGFDAAAINDLVAAKAVA